MPVAALVAQLTKQACCIALTLAAGKKCREDTVHAAVACVTCIVTCPGLGTGSLWSLKEFALYL